MKLGSSMRRRRGKGDEPPRPRETDADGDEEGATSDRARRLALRAGALALGGFGVGWIVATQVLFPGPPPAGDLFEVPDLHGLALAAAEERVQDAGLTVGAVETLGHPTADSGRVVGQSPLPGQLAAPGASVRISLSTGREERPVPDVTRLRGDRARTVLESAGFEVTVDSVQDDLPRGRIVSMRPAAGTDLPLPGEVGLTVSMGPPQVTLPLLEGMTEAQARDTLTALGLVVSAVEEVFRFGADAGAVVDQVPPAEAVVERGSAVRLLVGRSDTTQVSSLGRPWNKRPRRP